MRNIIIFIFCTVLIVSDADREVSFRNKRYYMQPKDVTVIENRELCESRGMTLAFVRDEAENNFIKSHVVNYLRLGAVWNRTNKIFEWEDGSPMTYTNWNSGSVCRESNYCCTVEMVSSGKWNIYSCSSQAHALCEHDSEKVPDVTNALNESLIALKEETDLKLANIVVKLDEWTVNITHEVDKIVKEEVKNIVKDEVTKLINGSFKSDDVDEKISKITTDLNANLTKVNYERISEENKIKDDLKGVISEIEAINQSRNMLKMEIVGKVKDELKDELDTMRNQSNHLVMDESRMINMINQLESEKDVMAHKLVFNEETVDNLSKRIVISLAVTLLLFTSLILAIGYRIYNDRKYRILYGFKKHPSPCSRASSLPSVQDDFV